MEDLVMKKTPIIVTGGAGFIGSHLVKRLVALKYQVIVADTHVEKHSYFSVSQLQKSVILKAMDIGDGRAVRNLVRSYPDAFIFHLAAETIVSECYEQPALTLRTNIMGTVNLLEAVRTTPTVPGMIVASSDKAYGKTNEPYTENSPLAGDHPYDVSKSAADLVTLAYAKTYNVPVAVTRFGNVYGEGDMHMDRLIPGLCFSIVKNRPLVVRSDGTYVRDYLYVEDVVDGYLLLWKQFAKAKGEAFNFSSPDTYSVVQVIMLAQKVLGKKMTYRIANKAINEIPYQHLNDVKAKKLGWQNHHKLASVLPRVYEWYRMYV